MTITASLSENENYWFIYFRKFQYIHTLLHELYNGVGGELPVDKLDISYMGPILKQARLSAQMTQEELAERIGKNSRYIIAIENEERSVSLGTLLKLIRALGISADAIAHPERKNLMMRTKNFRMIRLLNNRDRKVLLAAVRQMLEAHL